MFIGALSGMDYLWGINLWAYFGVPLIIAFSGGSILLMNKKTFQSVEKLIEKVNFGKKEFFIVLGVSFLLFILLRQSTFFLGDGYLRIRNMEILQYFSSGSPVGNYLSVLIFEKLAYPNGFSALSVWRLLSYSSGIISIIIFYLIGRKLFTDSKQFIFAGMLVFIGALSQMYFGYVESYSFYYTFLLGYYLSTLLMLKTGKYSLNPALWIISAFFISPTAVIFSPAVLYSYYSITLDKSREKDSVIKFFTPIVTVVIITLVVALALFLLGFTSKNYVGGLTKVNHILNLFPTENDHGILDIAHWNDILNQIFLVAPGFVLLFFVKWKSIYSEENKKINFLLINIACALLFMFIFRADISFVRDWDLFSFIAFPILFLIITAYFSREKSNFYAVYIAIVLAVAQTVPWILLNSNESMSLKRMLSISDIDYLPDYAKSNNYDVLRQYYKQGIEISNPSNYKLTDERREKLEQSLKYTTLAYNYEKNERYLYNIALYAYVLKEKDTAKKYLNLLNESNFESKYLGYALMSKLYIDEGNLPEAIILMKKQEDIFPDSETIKLDIAHLYYNAGEPRNSYDYFQKAFKINPENEQALDYLIELSYIADNKKKTIEYYRQYEKLKPGNPATYYNMAICFSQLKMQDSVAHYAQLAKKAGISEDMLEKIHNTK